MRIFRTIQMIWMIRIIGMMIQMLRMIILEWKPKYKLIYSDNHTLSVASEVSS
jgi:sugar phosphate permease